MLKQCAGPLSKPITWLFQKIVRSGAFPKSWKTARVTPIHKKGPSTSPSNYRPISVLPTLSTTFERVLLPQLRSRLLPYIPDEQFGFVPGAGTADVGIVITNEIAEALEAREELRVVALNIRGAFDRVWWRGLLAHLHSISIRERAFALLKSYLTDRSFIVVTNGEELCQIRSGVPQGRIWSPLLFDLFIRGLPEEARHVAMLCYADDVTLVMRIPTGERETSAALLKSDIERILDFGKKWLLQFEAKKAKAITISKMGYDDCTPGYEWRSDFRERDIGFLSFTLDSKGRWSPYIDRIAVEARQD